MEDLFTQQLRSPYSEDAIEDSDARAWAERLIRSVNEEISREERKSQDFIQAWVRWNDLASFISFVELSMIRKAHITSTEKYWHETISSGLIAIGGILREWSKTFDTPTLDLIGYNPKALETKIQTLRESIEDWHNAPQADRINCIQQLISEDD